MTLPIIRSYTRLCPSAMCHDLPLYVWLYALFNAESLSQWIPIGEIGFINRSISYMRILNYSASLLTNAKVINSKHIVESATHVCFLEAHEMAPPLNTNTHPLVKELASFYRSPCCIRISFQNRKISTIVQTIIHGSL